MEQQLFLDRFKKITNLGQGKCSKVVLVEDTEDNSKLYAMKIIDVKSIEEHKRQYFRQLMEGEVKCMEKMKDSPNLIVLYQSFQTKDKNMIYDILEYCEGGSLQSYQAKYPNGVFSLKEAIDILCQVLVGLQQLHMKGYIHRDLKCENILVTHSERGYIFKVADFGFSKQSIDIRGSYLGTNEYMSPEVLDCKSQTQKYGFQVDMWAFAVLFFVMLNGEFPFPTNTHVTGQLLRKRANNFSYRQFMKVHYKKTEQGKQPFLVNCIPEVQDIFKKMFQIDPKSRITFAQLKKHPLFAPHYPQILEECKRSHLKQMESRPQINIEGLQNKNLIRITSIISGKNRNNRYFDFLFMKEYRIQSGLIYWILFLKKNAEDFQSSDGLLKDYEASMISYNIHKYCAILMRNLKERIMQNKLKSKNTGLKQDLFFQQKKQFIILRNIDNNIRSIQFRLQILYDKCEKYLTQINQINSSFSSAFKTDFTEKAFEGSFKESYRKSTTYAYEVFRKQIEVKKENRILYFLAICMISHVFNNLYNNEHETAKIFKDYLKEKKKSIQEINFFELREWINNAQETLLDKMVKRIYSTYLNPKKEPPTNLKSKSSMIPI